jgi:hypothetical protein
VTNSPFFPNWTNIPVDPLSDFRTTAAVWVNNMKNLRRYLFEYLLLVVVILLTLAGFWNIYFGAEANPNSYQALHLITLLTWLFLLLLQLGLIGKNQYLNHRRVGLAILFVGPLLVATTAVLAVHSAHKGLDSAEGDPMIVGNVLAPLQLSSIIVVAFILKKRRAIHGAFLLSTAILFLGIALFFTVLAFMPDRFDVAGMAGTFVCLLVGILFFLKDRRNGWPMLIVGSLFTINGFISSFLVENGLILPLTKFIGSAHKPIVFLGAFTLMLILLALTVIPKGQQSKTKVLVADPEVG